jgi:hypothetical protein
VRPSPAPAYELRVALRAEDGQVHARTRLCWADMPSAAAVLEVLARRAACARRSGLRLAVEQAPAELGPLLALTGFSGCPERSEEDGPIVLGAAPPRADDVSVGELGG